MTDNLYNYEVFVTKVIDGDTIDGMVSLGFGITIKVRYRLNGIDTAEKNTELGKKTKEKVRSLIEGKSVYLKSYKPDKYGRYLADVYLQTDVTKSLNQTLIESGLAKPYHGESKSGLWTESETNV
jgi:micrococcal nuclease